MDAGANVVRSWYADLSGNYTVTGIPDGSWYLEATGTGYNSTFYPKTACMSCGVPHISPPAGSAAR